MTNDEALALQPGDRIRLRPQPGWGTNPPARMTFTVKSFELQGEMVARIVSVEGFRFLPWELDRMEER